MEAKSKKILCIFIAVIVVVVIAVALVLILKPSQNTTKVTFSSENAEASISQATINGAPVEGKMEAMVFSADNSKNTATTEKLNSWSDIDLTFNENMDNIVLNFYIFNQNTDKELNVKLSYTQPGESAGYTYTVSAMKDIESTATEITSGSTITLNPNSAGNGKLVYIFVTFIANDGVESATIDNFELTIELQSEASEPSVDEGDTTKPLYTVIDNNANNIVDAGDSIEFGYYPSTIKASDVTISGNTDANGYYTGSDGEKYAAAVSGSGMYDFSDGTEQVKGETYYFKVEPIVWDILSVDDGVAYLFSKYTLDYYISDNHPLVFEESGLSEWLNDDFYNKAFISAQQDIIQDTMIEEFNDPVKVTLMGEDIASAEYGFQTTIGIFDSNDPKRKKESTDYIRALFTYTSDPASYYIRTLDSNTQTGPRTVTSVNAVTGTFQSSFYGYGEFGIAPVVYIQLENTTISN